MLKAHTRLACRKNANTNMAARCDESNPWYLLNEMSSDLANVQEAILLIRKLRRELRTMKSVYDFNRDKFYERNETIRDIINGDDISSDDRDTIMYALKDREELMNEIMKPDSE